MPKQRGSSTDRLDNIADLKESRKGSRHDRIGKGKRGGHEGTERRHRKGEDYVAREDYNPRPKGKHKDKHKSSKGPKASIGVAAGHAVQEKRSSSWLLLLKALVATVFVLGYSAGVAYLILLLEEEKTRDRAQKSKSKACERVVCPMDTTCVTDGEAGLPRCGASSSQNVETMEIILAIVVGLPAAVCIPCSLQWIMRAVPRKLQRWYHAYDQQHRMTTAKHSQPGLPSTTESCDVPEYQDDLEDGTFGPVDPGLAGKLLYGILWWLGAAPGEEDETPSPVPITFADLEKANGLKGRDAEGKKPSKPAKSSSQAVADSASSDVDAMGDLFAPTRKRQERQKARSGGRNVDDDEEENEADEMDLLFTSWRAKEQPPEPPEQSLDGDDITLDVLFAKTSQPKSDEMLPSSGFEQSEAEQSFGALFTRPKRPHEQEQRKRSMAAPSCPALPRTEPGLTGGAQTEGSEGVSALFHAAGGSRAPSDGRRLQGRRSAGAASSAATQSKRTATSHSSAASAGEEDDGEVPMAVDFFGFALRVSRLGEGVSIDDPDEDDLRSNESGASGDSLAELELAALPELFHPPLGEPNRAAGLLLGR